MIRTAILTVGEAVDTPGGAGGAPGGEAVRAVREVLAGGPYHEVDYQAVPDEQALIRARLRMWSENEGVDLILTLGGIGLGPKERVPEATREVIDRDVPGLPELMRLVALKRDRRAALTRGVAGARRRTLIVNLPGGAAEAREALAGVASVLPEAVRAYAEAPGPVG